MITSFLMGHPAEWDTNHWVYLDNKEVIQHKNNAPINVRPCVKCGLMPTAEGQDPCIANLPGVQNACCGHGVKKGYIHFTDDRIIRGFFEIET
jgi:hypothetical protein